MNIKQWNTIEDEKRNASLLKDAHPNVKDVSISVVVTYECSVSGRKCIKEHEDVIGRDDRLFVWYRCPNDDCTGGGFNLWYEVKSAIDKRKDINGQLNCKGMESLDGCNKCPSQIEYSIVCRFL